MWIFLEYKGEGERVKLKSRAWILWNPGLSAYSGINIFRVLISPYYHEHESENYGSSQDSCRGTTHEDPVSPGP